MRQLICIDQKNPYLEDLRWVAHLSNGEAALRNDNIPGATPKNSWVRLKTYCEENELRIKSLKLQFRSHQIILPKAEAFWFTYALLASPSNMIYRWGVGSLEGSVVSIDFYQVPELIVVESVKRPVEECKESLILGVS